MSPFESVSARLGQALGRLDRHVQVAVLSCASRVLRPRYLEWSRDSGVDDQSELLSEALDAATQYATLRAGSPSQPLLAAVGRVIPAEPTDVPGFTAAQDCWICVDSALRVALGQFEAKDAAWYMLEPMFQATSERLFGVADVGSQAQDDAESEALGDRVLAEAIFALEVTIDDLGQERELADVDLGRITAALEVLSP